MAISADIVPPNIFSRMMSKSDCERFKSELENNKENAILSYVKPPCDFEFNDLTVCGENGEGTFDGGLGDWHIEGLADVQSVVNYTLDESNLESVYNNIDIKSPSACNGAPILDFLYLTSDNDPDFDIKDAVFYTYHGHLISPLIDLINVDFPQVKFYHLAYLTYLQANNLFLSYSIDDGMSWSDFQLIKSEALTYAYVLPHPEVNSIYIPEITNQTEVRIRFSALDQSIFAWFIDDITVEG